MSALGQKQTFAVQNVMSALPLIATAKADMNRAVGVLSGLRFVRGPKGQSVDARYKLK